MFGTGRKRSTPGPVEAKARGVVDLARETGGKAKNNRRAVAVDYGNGRQRLAIKRVDKVPKTCCSGKICVVLPHIRCTHLIDDTTDQNHT